MAVLPPVIDEDQASTFDHEFFIRRSSSGEYVVGGGHRRAARFDDVSRAVRALRGRVQLTIAEFCRTRAIVHAGVVTWNGNAVVCPGKSCSGKSTLVLAMVRAGAAYYSDEYAVFDRDGCVHPFTRPISIRTGGGEESIAPSLTGVEPVRPAIILFSRYRAGAAWAPQQMTPGSAVVELIRNSVSIRRNPGFVLEVLTTVAGSSVAYKSLRGDASAVVKWLQSVAIAKRTD